VPCRVWRSPCPTSVEFDSRGRLYASLTDGRILRIDHRTGAYTTTARIPHALLDNIVFGPDDEMYVTNYESGAVYAVRPGGRVRTLSAAG